MPELNVSINAQGSKKGAAEVNKAFNSVKTGANDVSKKTSVMGELLGAALPVAGIAGAAAAVVGLGTALVTTTDKYTNYASQMEYVTGSSEGAETALDDLYEMSQKTATSVDSNAQSLVLLSQANKVTGNTTEDNVIMLEKLNILMKKTGVSADSGKTAMLQLSQALASGTLSGDEFKSISESFPALMDQIATSLGVTKGELKKMASEQELTADVVIKAISGIEASYESLPKTASAGWQKVINSWEKALSAIGMENGVAGLLYDAFSKLSEWMDGAGGTFGPAMEYLTEVFSGFWNNVKGPLEEFYWMLSEKFYSAILWLLTDGQPVVETFKSAVGLAFEYMGAVIGRVYRTVTPILESLIDLIGWVIKKLAEVANSSIVQKGLSLAGTVIDKIAGTSDQETTSSSSGTTVNNTYNTQLTKSDTDKITNDQIRQAAQA